MKAMTSNARTSNAPRTRTIAAPAALLLSVAMFAAGCGSDAPKKDPEYHTSGSPAADQRAGERIAKDEQIRGKGGSRAEENRDVKRPLYDRLNGEAGLRAIVDDWVDRMLADARVDFTRKDVKGSLLHRAPQPWAANQHNVLMVKQHVVQFLATATGGPAKYEGKTIGDAHKGMRVSNAQFDAAVGDLQATMEKLGIAATEKKELLGVVETTRPMIVEEK